ncbi:hypothetical protein HYV31_04075 [candidate division WWE3 bacterium]|nr:hypothetical protein [candidate division WWE3 bacterium]
MHFTSSKKDNYLGYILLFFFISLVLTAIFFYGLKSNEFLMIGDQYFLFNFKELAWSSFYIKKLDNLGIHNSWQFLTQFWDVIFLMTLYKLGLSFFVIEKLQFFFALFITLSISFVGFLHIGNDFSSTSKASKLKILFITFWYSFNPYTVSLWHGGVYDIGAAITYSLAPLIFYFVKKNLFAPVSVEKLGKLALMLFVSSYVFWLFAPLVFLLVLYLLLSFFLEKKPDLKKSTEFVLILSNSVVLAFMYIPMLSFIIFNLAFQYFDQEGLLSLFSVPTYGNQQGGMWYQFLMLFSWGIYTEWTPRTIYSFHKYYLSIYYKLSTLAVYFIILYGVVKKLIKQVSSFSTSIVFLLLLFVLIFFSKAAQPPLGEIFTYLYTTVPLFGIFRTADIRFGFAIVLTVALFLTYISENLSKRVISLVFVVIMLGQSWFFFTGRAIKGEEIPGKYFDRIINITKPYEELISFLNTDALESGYVFPIPGMDYGYFILDSKEEEHYIGQGLLPKLVTRPFLSTVESGGMLTRTLEYLNKITLDKTYVNLKKFPIKYILVRKDLGCSHNACKDYNLEDLDKIYKLVFKNELFYLYQIPNHLPVLSAKNLTFKMLSPIKYELYLTNLVTTTQLNFAQSFSKHWKLYVNPIKNIDCSSDLVPYSGVLECVGDVRALNLSDITYLFSKPVFTSTHVESVSFANTWGINPDYITANLSENFYSINTDGSVNIRLTLFFFPQAQFLLALVLTLLSVLFVVTLTIVKRTPSN